MIDLKIQSLATATSIVKVGTFRYEYVFSIQIGQVTCGLIAKTQGRFGIST
ncbi:MAG: hypothetical protein ABJG41_17245 [Cyclobacteriaceae bacterium]